MSKNKNHLNITSFILVYYWIIRICPDLLELIGMSYKDKVQIV